MEEHYLFEVEFYDGFDGKKTFVKYIITSEEGVEEFIEKISDREEKGIELKEKKKLCKEEEISSGLWKESVVGMFADKVEQILLEYRASNCFELGRDEEEIKEIATYIFDEILKEWKTNKTVEELAEERESSYDYVVGEIDKMRKEELEKYKREEKDDSK